MREEEEEGLVVVSQVPTLGLAVFVSSVAVVFVPASLCLSRLHPHPASAPVPFHVSCPLLGTLSVVLHRSCS